MSKDKAHIDEVFTRSENKATPVLLKFQNGALKNANKESALYFPVNCKLNKTKRAVVVASGSVYSGPVSGGSQELVDTYVCIRNKTTDKVRILPVDQVKLINHVYEDKQKTQFGLLSKESAYEAIMRNFGGRRALRHLQQRERTDIKINVFHDQLETTIENTSITEEEQVSTEGIIDSIRPKFNKEATNLLNLYNVYDIIPLELIDRLDEEVSVLMSTDIEDIPISSEFLKSSIASLRVKPKSTLTLLRMKIILYMDGLRTLIISNQKNLSRLELSKITEKVENDIRDRFSSPNILKFYRSSFTGEKALCYFLVLAFLISDNFTLDLDTLSKELQMSKAKILKYGSLVNATCRSKTNTFILRLPNTTKQGTSVNGKRKSN